MRTHTLDHPLVASLLTTLRDRHTPAAAFRAALRDLSGLLVYEALRDAPVQHYDVETPVAVTRGVRLVRPPLLVPVLRAGLGMVDAATNLVPESNVGFVGIARDERTHRPVPYLESLPEDLSATPVMVLDPMLATGGSMLHAVEQLDRHGATDITVVCVVSAPEGIAALAGSGLPVRLVTAVIDDRLDDDAFIVPGLGDAGDRQYGPR